LPGNRRYATLARVSTCVYVDEWSALSVSYLRLAIAIFVHLLQGAKTIRHINGQLTAVRKKSLWRWRYWSKREKVRLHIFFKVMSNAHGLYSSIVSQNCESILNPALSPRPRNSCCASKTGKKFCFLVGRERLTNMQICYAVRCTLGSVITLWYVVTIVLSLPNDFP
jgi:hypothetical protein